MAEPETGPRPNGLLLSDDLMFISRVTGTAQDLGLAMRAARSADALLASARREPPTAVILDLANPGLAIEGFLRQLQEACRARPFVVAYGSHVNAAGLKRARDAGCDVILPRSKFVEELPAQLPRWLGRET